MTKKVVIRRLPTGVPGLDALLQGGLAEYSFNLIAGAPGSGKTTLAHQIMFALANPDRRAIFFTVLGEPPLKMLRYQQQYSFFDPAKVNDSIRFINLADEIVAGDYDRVLKRIVEEVERFGPSLVMVDSFRSVIQSAKTAGRIEMDLQKFVQRLGMLLTTWEATTFLIGEYVALESEANPIFTVADGIIWMAQSVERNSVVRKIQITKMRGHATIPGLHTFRISDDGLQIFPRRIAASPMPPESNISSGHGSAPSRLSMGVPLLDEMMGGGLPAGYSLLVAGPSGSGKSQLAAAFLAEGARAGEKGVIAAFEKIPARSHKMQLDELIASGEVGMIDTRSLDLSIDETLHALTELIERTGATRVVIDSISGFELALAPSFREDFRESLYRMIAVLTGMGAAVLMISELEDRYTDLRFSPYGAAFLTDAIIVQRYVELEGQLKRVMAVVKMRNSDHSHELRFYEVTDAGIVIGPPTPGMTALLTGHPRPS
ncbi:ATPase domain-containing protein [Variovorax sp. J22G21]|uniref:ATPase domain-containing protein n=1 Tax=Variovorax fucosicus TaxID=3053517 RepID=UPI002574B18B|nr:MULTISPECIES: ATPase domain-containing protein [unclassified Variovorax]MDM0037649.1 ATPase domain-containing protein [Variovorax sp. J22R193]MDM0062425.1 ATPase domain-containing protein [Variovorax sp. J22G21]